MKIFLRISLAIILSTNAVVQADIVANPMADLRDSLEASLSPTDTSSSLSDLKAVATDRNVDIEIAFQNYIIAKKRVSIARAALNPLTTGHVLGLALGINYLWAPVVLEAVLSIPTKLHNVKANKFLSRAEFYNSQQARLALNNEMAHLYYDILTHEVILKSLDQELALLNFHDSVLRGMKDTAYQIKETKGRILALQIERIDIYNLYVEEMAAMRTLLSMDPSEDLKLKQVAIQLKKSFLDDLKTSDLEKVAVANSNDYKKSINIRLASESNIKAVKWSILSFSGMTRDYKSRVKSAKVSAEVAGFEQSGTQLKVKNSALIRLNNLNSSLNVLENYTSIYESSMGLAEDFYKLYTLGDESEGAALETSITAIRDFRNKVMSHYVTWSALDDFSSAVSVDFKYEQDADRAQVQLGLRKATSNSSSSSSDAEFSVFKSSETSTRLILKIDSKLVTSISKVEYIFDENVFASQVSLKDTRDFYAVFTKSAETPSVISGVAKIVLYNGQKYEVKFKL